MKLPFCSAAATSDLPQSAIRVELDTGDVRGVLGRKKRYGAGNLLRLPKALHWYFRSDLLCEFINGFLWQPCPPKNRSDNWPRSNRVDANAASDQFCSRTIAPGSYLSVGGKLCLAIEGRV